MRQFSTRGDGRTPPTIKIRDDVKYRFAILALALCPLSLAAKETALRSDTKKFLPLERGAGQVRTIENGVALVKPTKTYGMRSDKSELKNGFMRLDRAARATASPQTVPRVAENQSVKVTAGIPENVEPESEEIQGNTESVDPVLALFDGGGDGTLSSFRDALRTGGQVVVDAARQNGWPIPLNVKQYISSGYGMRADPFHGRPTFHGGIDIVAPTGTPVLATADGEVTEVKTDMNYGKYVSLQHADGTISRYGHLGGQSVRVGQRVRAGQEIGEVGLTGRTTGAHLDYRVSKNGVKFDPLAVLAVPANVAMKGEKSPTTTASSSRAATKVASNSVQKRPMVIQVR